MCDVCSYHRHCFDFEGTTRFAWYNTILKTKKCKIGGIDAERILDVIFFAQSKYSILTGNRRQLVEVRRIFCCFSVHDFSFRAAWPGQAAHSPLKPFKIPKWVTKIGLL